MSTLSVDTITEQTTNNGVQITGHVIQVVSTTKTDNFSMSNQTYTDVTGLNATITPKSTSSKILAKAYVNLGGQNNYYAVGRIARGGNCSLLIRAELMVNAGMSAANSVNDYAQYYMEAMVMEFLDSLVQHHFSHIKFNYIQ